MICDVAYQLFIDQRRAEYLADRQAYYTAAITNGAKDAVYPSWDETQADLDADLAADDLSPNVRLLRELGVA